MAQGAGGSRGAGQAGGGAGAAGPDCERAAAGQLSCCCSRLAFHMCASAWTPLAGWVLIRCCLALPQASLETHKREMLGLPNSPAPQAWVPPAPAHAAPRAAAEPALRLSDASLVSAWASLRGVARVGLAAGRCISQEGRLSDRVLSVASRSHVCCLPRPQAGLTLPPCPCAPAVQSLMRSFKKQLCLNTILDLGFSAQQAQVRGACGSAMQPMLAG